MKLPRISAAPPGSTLEQRRNFINVQVDAIGVGLAAAASPFLPILLTRLGASNFEVGLLSSMPALTGLLLAIPVGRFLQSRRQVVPWFSAARLVVLSAYALTGIVTLILPESWWVKAILAVWALATIPLIMVNVSFSVVMNAVAGPTHRYELMSRRWSILGVTVALTVALAGRLLDHIAFPLNYQVVFIALSLGGLISYYFSSHIRLPDAEPPPSPTGLSAKERSRQLWRLVLSQREFVNFTIKRFVFLTGVSLALPIFPLYYVRVVNASDASIGLINTAQSAILLVGYFLWTRESRLRGSRFVLVWTTLGLSIYPALVAATQHVDLIIIYAGLAGIFQAGLDLVFFDELMKTVPVEYSATFISLAQGVQHFSSFVAPMLGAWLAGSIGLAGALLISAAIRLIGFALFALWKPRAVSA
ncbi:MAG: MFS transporter [Chloroflexi bacterium]|nr:MFS transporter [Chloroflexota bacterium]